MKYVKIAEIKGYEDVRINIGTPDVEDILDSKSALRMFAINSEPGEDVEAWVKVQKVIESIGKASGFIAIEDDHWAQAMKNKKKIAAKVFGINCPQILENFDALVSDKEPDKEPAKK
jgi:hypothetical protein